MAKTSWMTFQSLREFLLQRMKMTFVYQPVVIRTLLETRGRASVREIAIRALAFDEAQVEYYVRVVNRYPRQVLTQHGVLDASERGYFRLKLDFDDLSQEQIDELVAICDAKISEYIASYDGLLGDHRYNNKELHAGQVRYLVLKRAHGRCQLCGASVEETAIDVDHVIPRSKGGSNDLSNLQALCYRCNRAKGNRDKTDFREYGVAERDGECPFCNLGDRIIGNYNTAVRVLDAFPVSMLHTLVIPRRHVQTPSQLTAAEIQDLFQLAWVAKSDLQLTDPTIEGFNIGFNDGKTAGQTINHVHMHLIPRRKGDVENPRGGIRNVLPSGDYVA